MRTKKYIFLLIALFAVATSSCKKDKDDSDTTIIYSTSTTNALVSSFNLQANAKVLANLDSVHFTVDALRGQIYNVDSLPVGTNVSRLLTRLTFKSAVGTVKYYLTYSKGGVVQRDTITYSSSSTDSLNFTGTAILEVSSYDGTVTRRYNIHVNVHQSKPDTLVWPMTARRDLPGSGDDNLAQRTVQCGDQMVCMVQTSTGYNLSIAPTAAGPWTTVPFTPDFEPDVNSLAASNHVLYMLDTAGQLHSSTNGETWTATGIYWLRLIGGYDDRVLGITTDESPLLDEYPRRDTFVPMALPVDFPVSEQSQLVMSEHKWTVAPQAVMVGGVLADGSLSHKTWGYDGNTWATISSENDTLPALRGVTLISYYTYDVNVFNQKATKQPTWLIMGGYNADGSANRTTYMSRNQGITWSVAPSTLQWPDYLPSMGGAQAFIAYQVLTSSHAPRRVSQPVTEWDTPYIYLFGGYDNQGALQNNVWRGVINRLTYKPSY